MSLKGEDESWMINDIDITYKEHIIRSACLENINSSLSVCLEREWQVGRWTVVGVCQRNNQERFNSWTGVSVFSKLFKIHI